MKKISVVIPAHNEGNYIGKCLSSIRLAESKINIPVEIVVCLNRCSDNTETIAKAFNASTVTNDTKNIASIRNTGIRASTGSIVVTIDADSWMTPGTLSEIVSRLESGKYLGGGIRLKSERLSAGTFSVEVLYRLFRFITGLSGGGAYWILRKDFDEIGGFDEEFISAETIQFSAKIKSLARKRNLKPGYIYKETIYTSARKFDQLGDWYLFKNTKEMYGGRSKEIADKVWYDTER